MSHPHSVSVDAEKEGKKTDAPSIVETVSADDSFTEALLTSAQDEAGNEARYTTTRKELWSFYAYYIGNSGLGEHPTRAVRGLPPDSPLPFLV